MNELTPDLEQVKENAKNKSTWTKGFFLLVFIFILGLGKTLLIAILAFQFVHILLTGKLNNRLITFGGRFCHYLLQVMEYMIFVRDDRPFPFGEWPSRNIES